MDTITYHMIRQEKRIRNQSYESQMDKLMDYFSIKDLRDETINSLVEDLREAGADHLVCLIKLKRSEVKTYVNNARQSSL